MKEKMKQLEVDSIGGNLKEAQDLQGKHKTLERDVDAFKSQVTLKELCFCSTAYAFRFLELHKLAIREFVDIALLDSILCNFMPGGGFSNRVCIVIAKTPRREFEDNVEPA